MSTYLRIALVPETKQGIVAMDSQDTLDVAKPKYGRRRFLSHGASAVVGLISAFAHSGGVLATSLAKSDRKVRGLVRRLHTVRRLGGNGDGWAMTWASDDSQFISLNDGTGWPGLPEYEQQNSEFHNRVYKISGFPESIQYEYLPGYPNIINMLNVMSRKGMPDNIPMSDPSLFYGYGIVAANGRVYQLLSGLTPSTYTEKDRLSFSGIKLIYSDDNGTTWRNQDGSYPVTFETWPKRSDKCMLFLGGAFSKLTPLQMGKNYALNKDGYMYIYGPLGNSPGDLRNLALCRVPTPKILERAAYEFFVQRKRDGSASWSKKEADARAVHTFPELQIDAIPFPWAWVPSVAYFAALDTYLMFRTAGQPRAGLERAVVNRQTPGAVLG